MKSGASEPSTGDSENCRLSELLLDAAQAGPELVGILERLIGQVAAERQARRFDELLGKVTSERATAEERLEFQALNKRPAHRPP